MTVHQSPEFSARGSASISSSGASRSAPLPSPLLQPLPECCCHLGSGLPFKPAFQEQTHSGLGFNLQLRCQFLCPAAVAAAAAAAAAGCGCLLKAAVVCHRSRQARLHICERQRPQICATVQPHLQSERWGLSDCCKSESASRAGSGTAHTCCSQVRYSGLYTGIMPSELRLMQPSPLDNKVNATQSRMRIPSGIYTPQGCRSRPPSRQ